MSRAPTELHAALFAVFVTTLCWPARADPIHASLTVTRDDGARDCPDFSTLAQRVETVAGKTLFGANADEPRDTWVQVEFVRAIGGYHAVISARGSRQGTRSLDDVGPDCTSLADAVSITLAILLDPATAPRSEPPPLVIANPVVASARVDSPPKARPSPKSEAQRERSVFGMEASAGASLAMVNSAVPLVEAGGRARIGEIFAVAIGAGLVFPERIEHGQGSIDVSLTYGYARGCANLLPRKTTALETCLEPLWGALRGAGHDYDTNDTQWVFWSAAAVLLQAYGPISESVLWSLRARVLAPFAQHGFSVAQNDATEQPFRLSVIGGSLAFGIDAEL